MLEVDRLVEFASTPGFVIYFASLVLLGGLATVEIVRGRGSRAFVYVVAIVLVSASIRFGEDFLHHDYRIAALVDQVRSGAPSLLITNPDRDEVLPIFVYYSFVPYLPAVALDLAGLSPHLSLRVMTIGMLIVLVLGLVQLISLQRDGKAAHTAFLAAILFLCANYVHNLWLVRHAYAEMWVYCLIPWVTVMLLRPGSLGPLAALLFLQIVGHPLVFTQAFACALLIAWVLSKEAPRAILARYAAATAIALLVAVPFWLPQVLWEKQILGPAGLPTRFAEHFLSFIDLVDPRGRRGLGFPLILAVVLMLATTRASLSARAWVLFTATAALVAIQTRPLLPIAEHLPLLPSSIFIWRLMFPAALLAFVLLLVGWRARPAHDAVLGAIAILSVASLAIVQAARAPHDLKAFAHILENEADWIRFYSQGLGWGKIEFLPDYSRLPRHCSEAQRASFADLMRGVYADKPYVAVPAAPLAGLDYLADGTPAQLSACEKDLMIGPIAPGALVRASSSTLALVLKARLAALAVCGLGWLAWIAFRRRPALPANRPLRAGPS